MGRGKARRPGARPKKTANHPAVLRFKKWVLSIFGLCLMALCPVHNWAADCNIWHKSDNGIDEVGVNSVRVIGQCPGLVFAGCRKSVYKSCDWGGHWDRVFMLTGEREGINCLSYDPNGKSIIYAATSNGLYVSVDCGSSWTKRHSGPDEAQRDIQCIAHSIQGDIVIIGARRGLYKSYDSGLHWSAEGYFINKEIRSVHAGKGFFYVCADDGVYYQETGSDAWDRVYNLIEFGEESDNNIDTNDETEPEYVFKALNSIAMHEDNVYICTGNGILLSKAGGNSWTRLNSEGLLSQKMNYIIATPEYLLGASRKGIFKYEYKEGKWKDYSAGLSSLEINMLDVGSENDFIFAATQNGLFRIAPPPAFDREARMAGPRRLLPRVPGISEIQKAAIEYAEVSPEKIKWMRQAAKTQALIPDLSLSLDGNDTRTIELDRGGTNDSDIFIEGPKDKNLGWGIRLDWDLSELIWSYHQTNIDVRSRLMVQLRNDILNEVTKIYFERLRLMDELADDTNHDDAKVRLKQIRLAELTADIDALTGGYLSKSIDSGGCGR